MLLSFKHLCKQQQKTNKGRTLSIQIKCAHRDREKEGRLHRGRDMKWERCKEFVYRALLLTSPIKSIMRVQQNQ